MKAWFELIWTFAKIGASTFGGGYAMIPVLERELIRGKGWITLDEVMEYYTIAQITPGVIAVNVSTFVGYKRKGIFGGIAATVSFMLPGVALMAIIALFISGFAGYPAVQHAFAGIRVAVGTLVLDTVWKLISLLFKPAKKPSGPSQRVPAAANSQSGGRLRNLRKIAPALIAVAAFALPAIVGASPALIVAGAGAVGFFLWRPNRVSRRNTE
ncbi:MAG: chromate transporter [Treponema sp.]|jgi:chromate transporter|nr:chromate transporter [Treponema sp.]